MLAGYRTYLLAIAIIVHQILNAFGFMDFTGDQISVALDVILGILVMVFRKKAMP